MSPLAKSIDSNSGLGLDFLGWQPEIILIVSRQEIIKPFDSDFIAFGSEN